MIWLAISASFPVILRLFEQLEWLDRRHLQRELSWQKCPGLVIGKQQVSTGKLLLGKPLNSIVLLGFFLELYRSEPPPAQSKLNLGGQSLFGIGQNSLCTFLLNSRTKSKPTETVSQSEIRLETQGPHSAQVFKAVKCFFVLSQVLWELVGKMHQTIKPEEDRKRQECWEKAQDMLAPLVDFEWFRPRQYYSRFARTGFETRVVGVLKNYEDLLQKRPKVGRHMRPRELGETRECLYLEKPCHFICNYGTNWVPPVSGVETSTELLHSGSPTIQIHEYIALEYNHETASGCREFWRKIAREGIFEQPCTCGTCKQCACFCAGCCHRLDRETSGVMIVAKTTGAYWHIRHQFFGEHNEDRGGIAKYYFALVCGDPQVLLSTVFVSFKSQNLVFLKPKGGASFHRFFKKLL